MSRRLLIDADAVAFRAACASQSTYDWGDDVVSKSTDVPLAKTIIRNMLDEWMAAMDGTEFTICLSDDFDCFRKKLICPTYKHTRVSVERPAHLYDLKQWMEDTYGCDRRRTLEADDVMGILSTEPHTGDRIIVSQDKDMQTIPGLLYRPYSENPAVTDISLAFADRFHLWQALVGDTVDGYAGCPGVGPVAADKALDGGLGKRPSHVEVTRGPNKGAIRTTFVDAEMSCSWEVVVSLFHKAGLTEGHALTQARLAKILRHEDFNGAPILWSPKR